MDKENITNKKINAGKGHFHKCINWNEILIWTGTTIARHLITLIKSAVIITHDYWKTAYPEEEKKGNEKTSSALNKRGPNVIL